jgi:drug/metabolite transporter (DMT)-like permease
MKKTILLLPVLAGIMFGAAGVFVRNLTAYGMTNPTIIFLRTSFAALELLLLILLTDKSLLRIRPSDFLLFLVNGLSSMIGLTLCYNIAVNHLTLSLAAILLSTAPIFVIFLAAIIFKEKITKRKIFCMILAILGCILASGLLESNTGLTISLLGLLGGIASAVLYALYSIFPRLSSDKEYHTYTIIFYSVLLAAILMLPFAQFRLIGGFVIEAPIRHIVLLIFHSLCLSVLPYVFITTALTRAEAGLVSIFASGSEPIVALIFGMIFYQEVPSFLAFCGMLVTITALVILCKGTGVEKA